jgi:hypothetical protein
LEPASCAIHGLDKLRPKIGVEVLLFGAGPTGLILAQLLKQNGARRVVIAAPAGMKMELAKKLNAGDEYVELVRGDKDAQAKQWAELKKNNPCEWRSLYIVTCPLYLTHSYRRFRHCLRVHWCRVDGRRFHQLGPTRRNLACLRSLQRQRPCSLVAHEDLR